MGNRAAIIFHDGKETSPSIYVHWNGGPESIYAWLEEADRRKIRRTYDLSFCTARFLHIIGDFFDQDSAGTTSLGIFNTPGTLAKTKKGVEKICGADEDNGLYLISGNVGTWAVERYLGRWLTPDEVASEREEAIKHDYNASIRETFTRIRPKIENSI